MRAIREALHAVLGTDAAWERVRTQVPSEHVVPDASLRAVGDAVDDVLVVECGLCEVVAPGEPPRWADAGSMIGIGAAVSGGTSPVRVVARRHTRVIRVPGELLWDHGGDPRDAVRTVARLATLPDRGLHALPPDPLVVAVLLEALGEPLERLITERLRDAADGMPGTTRVVDVAATIAGAPDLARALDAHERDATTVVYAVRGADGALAATLVDHADHTLVFQRVGGEAPRSEGFRRACDGSARRHTELVDVGDAEDPAEMATRQWQLPPTVRQVHRLPEPSSRQLETLLTDLRGRAREHEALRGLHAFAELTGPELAWVQGTLRWTRVDGGRVLVRQGDRSEGAWLVRSGRLEELRTTASGERLLSVHGPGDVIGVSVLIRRGVHAASVRAVRDSTVARLTPETFDALMQRSTGFGRAIARLLASEVVGRAAGDPDRATTIAVVPLVERARAGAFVADLSAACEDVGLGATVVDAARVNDAMGPHASDTRRGDVGDAEIIRWLDRLEHGHDVVVLVCEPVADSWTRRAIRQADHLLFVADSATPPSLRPIERELAAARDGDATIVAAPHLVLLQRNGLTEATGTGAWLAERPRHAHHHLRAGEAGDLARLARRLTGRAVALALSGASARAVAHLGVVRAMEDVGLPIDVVSGSSSGGGIAAIVAAGLRGEAALSRALQIITAGSPRMTQFQPPVTALTSGAGADRALQAVFGDRQLEDQYIPALLTAVDIRRHRAVHLTRGPIWKLMRASGSLPLLWPPVWHEDALLVDGGILDYLPTEVFGREVERGLVVASNLDATAGAGAPAFEGALNYGTRLNGWHALARRIVPRGAPTPPGIVDILFHAMAIPSFQQQEGLSALAARDDVCLLTPPLGSFGLFDVDDRTGRALEVVAWEHARNELRGVASRWHARPEWPIAVA